MASGPAPAHSDGAGLLLRLEVRPSWQASARALRPQERHDRPASNRGVVAWAAGSEHRLALRWARRLRSRLRRPAVPAGARMGAWRAARDTRAVFRPRRA